MSRRAYAAFLASGALVALAGCNKGSAGPAFRLAQPSAVAVFQGFAHKNAGLHPYVAVANSGKDELVLFDPVDDVVVASPILIRPLSVPLPTPRPALLASAAFTVPEGKSTRPDLLVVIGAGSTQLQLIRTWTDASDPDPGLVEAAAVDLGGEIMAVAAAPAFDGAGQPVPDLVRVVAALTGGRLAVVEYRWTPEPSDATGATGSAAPVSPAPAIQDLGFDAISLAVDASVAPVQSGRKRFLYAATVDPVPPSNVSGVAQLDMSGPLGGWTISALNAHAPTLLVAAYTLRERVTGVEGAYDQVTTPTAGGAGGLSSFVDADHVVSRVYAFRDPAFCGPATGVACGIVVLDRATGDVLEDPWHPGATPKQFLPPIAAPGIPVVLVPGPPPQHPPENDFPALETPDFMVMSLNTGARITGGVLFMPSDDGRSYFADLSRWEVPGDTLEVNPAGTPAGVFSYLQSAINVPRIGFYVPGNVAQADAANGTSRARWEPGPAAAQYMKATPGFTPDDTWTVTYQGYLPAFAANRLALVEDAGGGQLRVALQATTTSRVVNVFDPALAVRVGDIVELLTAGISGCPDTSAQDANGIAIAPVEGKIVSIDKPDPGHPGGSLVIQPGDCVPFVNTSAKTECEDQAHGPWRSMATCWPGDGSPSLLANKQLQVRIRAGGGGDPADTDLNHPKDFVVVGVATGYAGRATSQPAPTQPPAELPPLSFIFANDGEADLVAACPLIPYPSDFNLVPACDETCRRGCEAAAVARRARRHHLTSVFCFKSDSDTPGTKNYCETFFPEFAKHVSDTLPVGTFDQNTADHSAGEPPRGPALAFSLGLMPASAPGSAESVLVVRGTQVMFSTRSGRTPVSRWGGGGNNGPATGPADAAYFDRSDPAFGKQDQRARFFVPHVGNLILDTSPSQSNSQTHVLR